MNRYSFTAGPASETYTVETPWTTLGIYRALVELRRTAPWLTLATLKGIMLTLVDGPALDEVFVDPMDGTGQAIRLGAVRRALDAYSV